MGPPTPRRDPPSSARGALAALLVAVIMAALLVLYRGESGTEETGSVTSPPPLVPTEPR